MGFVQTMSPDSVWIFFYKNYSFGFTFLVLYYSKFDYLVIINELKTIKDSKLLFLVYFSIFIIYLDVAI